MPIICMYMFFVRVLYSVYGRFRPIIYLVSGVHIQEDDGVVNGIAGKSASPPKFRETWAVSACFVMRYFIGNQAYRGNIPRSGKDFQHVLKVTEQVWDNVCFFFCIWAFGSHLHFQGCNKFRCQLILLQAISRNAGNPGLNVFRETRQGWRTCMNMWGTIDHSRQQDVWAGQKNDNAEPLVYIP